MKSNFYNGIELGLTELGNKITELIESNTDHAWRSIVLEYAADTFHSFQKRLFPAIMSSSGAENEIDNLIQKELSFCTVDEQREMGALFFMHSFVTVFEEGTIVLAPGETLSQEGVKAIKDWFVTKLYDETTLGDPQINEKYDAVPYSVSELADKLVEKVIHSELDHSL